MKHLLLFPFLLFPVLSAQQPKTQENRIELLDHQKAFLNLPEDQRKIFIETYAEANRLFQQKRIFESLENLHKANKIFEQSTEVHNLYGSCYVEMRAFDKAMTSFEKAASLAPKNISIMFNIAEVHFVTHEWRKSHDLFQEVLKLAPAENIALTRLIEFKILLCKSKLGEEEEVIIMSEKYDFLDDSPYYYFAKAAISYSKNQNLEAEQWLARAYRIFRDPAVLAPWQDTLVEFGYIKSFFNDPDLQNSPEKSTE